MASTIDFDSTFAALTGNAPFPWQQVLYRQFLNGEFPSACNLPTGLGKTSIIAIWLIALAQSPKKIPRRLVYVVNRRTVVDQTTKEVVNIRNCFRGERVDAITEIANALAALSGSSIEDAIAISTLRGQFADNREWSADPSKPAIIIGTVDMIGSRLLFSGYGVGFKHRPLHAGFLGQDVLLVHDEAHLEPAFQILLTAIKEEQTRCGDFARFQVLAMSATSRDENDVFTLTKEERLPPAKLPAKPTKPIHHVWRRLRAKKGIQFHSVNRADVAKKIGEIARDRWATSAQAILIFVRSIEDIKTVKQVLISKSGVSNDNIQILTGTMRGRERDSLAASDPVFARFLRNPEIDETKGTVFLICTSAGEVGIDISADHLVCDLTTLDSMTQRLGRVNRRGDGAAEIDIVYESDPDPKSKSPDLEHARWATKEVLESLHPCDWIADRNDASPLSLWNLRLPNEIRDAAFAPVPRILPVHDILFDSWALTTIRTKLPGRRSVEPYLHGVVEWQPPETHVAWREEVTRIGGELLKEYPAKELLEDYPLQPQELLRDRSDRVFKELELIAKRRPKALAWLLDEDGVVETLTLEELVNKDQKARLESKTVVLPPSAGGLGTDGMLDGRVEVTNDVADTDIRIRIDDNDESFGERTKKMRTIRRIVFSGNEENNEDDYSWYWLEAMNADTEWSRTSRTPVLWDVHTSDVERQAERILEHLPLSEELKTVIKLAATFHDYGKRRMIFQNMLGNLNFPNVALSKSGKKIGRTPERYRHEFGSLFEVQRAPEFQRLSADNQDLVLHIIAAHHGRGRPHFSADEAFDPQAMRDAELKMTNEIPIRFARMQRKYGRWGLAYLESLLRAADCAASANPSEPPEPL